MSQKDAKQLVFGHQNPDTDAISAAKSYSYLENKLGYNTEAVALGEPNEETKFVLKHFDIETPRVVKKAKPEVNYVMLVDHNEKQQSISDLDDVTVTHVVDHHRIANFSTAQPLYYRAEPLGCASTIVNELFEENNVEVPKKLAGLMVSAIISDTLLLKSPTTTDKDVATIKKLAKIADVDYQKYGIQMLKAGTNVADKSAQDLIDEDAKSYTLGGKSLRIDQINVVDLKDILDRKDEIKDAMKKESQNQNYDLFLIMVTDVLNSDSSLIAVGDPKVAVNEAFNKELNSDGIMELPGVVSRKKQVVPPLTNALK